MSASISRGVNLIKEEPSSLSKEQILIKVLKALQKEPQTTENMIKEVLILLELSLPKKEVKKQQDYTPYIQSKINMIQNDRAAKGLGVRRKPSELSRERRELNDEIYVRSKMNRVRNKRANMGLGVRRTKRVCRCVK